MIKPLLTAAMLTAAFAVYASPVKLGFNNNSEITFPDTKSENTRLINPVSGSEKKAPATRAEDSDWEYIGEGYYRDILFSDLFKTTPQVLKVRVEQSKSEPMRYRIPNLYENLDLTDFNGYLTYDASKAEPLEIEVYYDEYGLFYEFDTGIYSTYKNLTNDYSGEIKMLMQGTDLLLWNDVETLIWYLPESLLYLKEGNFTMESPTFLDDNNNSWSNILGHCYVTGGYTDLFFRGNSKGDFMLTLPDSEPYDPNTDWEDIGMALYTDSFTEGLYTSSPVYGEWEVPVQRKISNPEYYRLVNPYANYKSPIAGMTFDKENDYNLEFIVRKYEGFSLVGIPDFNTGLYLKGYGYYSVGNQASELVRNITDYLGLYYSYIGCLGYMEDDNVITFSSHCMIDYTMIQNMFAWFGDYDPDYGTFYSANSKGNFKIVLPDPSGISNISADTEAPVQYFNLQGVRVENPAKGQLLIKRNGSKSEKIIF